MMLQKKWFSVETLPDGSIGEAKEVAAKGRNGSVVRYYEAVDLADACSQAKAWYARVSEYQKERRLARQVAGLCANACGRKAKKNRRRCELCLQKNLAATRARISAIALGLPPKRCAHESPQSAQAARRRSNAQTHASRGGSRGSALRTALVQLDSLGPIAFRDWLVNKINRISDSTHQVK